MINELKKYAEYQNDEIGDALSLMISLYGYEDYIPKELHKILTKCLKEQLKWYEENTRFITKEINIPRTITELEFKGRDF